MTGESTQTDSETLEPGLATAASDTDQAHHSDAWQDAVVGPELVPRQGTKAGEHGRGGWPTGRHRISWMSRHPRPHPSLRPSPVEHATREGLHSGDLLLGNAPVVTTLENLIESAVTRYVEDGTHPFMTTAPVDVVLSAWAVVMGRGGHQLPHVHPAGWLSGVYYLRIPAASAERPDAGSIEFGLPDPKLGLDGTPSTRTVRPEAGSFVLFPSYLYHRTLPNDTGEQRISIAFDVMPDPATQPP